MSIPGGWHKATRTISRSVAKLGLSIAGFAMLTATASAVPINPNPAVWANDNGATVFTHESLSLAIKRASLPSATIPILFGFYFDGTGGIGTGGDGLANGGIIFDNADAVGDRALIDFNQGKVFDLELSAVQSTFTKSPPGNGEIGFFIAVKFPNTANFVTYYTDPTLNPLGLDLAATFPALADPTFYLVSFDVPTGADSFTLAYSVQLTNLSVPEPSSIALLGLALLLLASCSGVQRRS